MSKIIQCKDCTRVFSFSEEDQRRFQLRGWKAPIRCKRCIEKAKRRRQDPYWGWESTMGDNLHAPKGHKTVNNPFHVVGGYR